MSWKYKYPSRDEYDTEEEYEEACAAYESAESLYEDMYRDEQRGI